MRNSRIVAILSAIIGKSQCCKQHAQFALNNALGEGAILSQCCKQHAQFAHNWQNDKVHYCLNAVNSMRNSRALAIHGRTGICLNAVNSMRNSRSAHRKCLMSKGIIGPKFGPHAIFLVMNNLSTGGPIFIG